MKETKLGILINDHLFPKEVLNKKLVLPFCEYVTAIYGCDSQTAQFAQSIVSNLAPLCERSPAFQYRLDTKNLRDNRLMVDDVIKSDIAGETFALTRGSGPLIYTLGPPKMSDVVPRLWQQYTNSFLNAVAPEEVKESVRKIAPARDCDIMLKFDKTKHQQSEIMERLEQTIQENYQLMDFDDIPIAIKEKSGRYLNPEAKIYRKGNSYVFVGRAKRKTNTDEYRNTIIDFYTDDKQTLRLDIDVIDPHSSLADHYRYGARRPIFDFATTADIVHNPEGDLNVIIHPYLLQYFSESRIFSQATSHTSFTHAITGLLREIETLVFFAGNFSKDIDIFKAIEYWTRENPHNLYKDFDNWSFIVGYGRTNEEQISVARKEMENLQKRKEEITASYLRSMTRNPFLFLAVASGLHLMTHISRGPEEHFADSFLPEIRIMAKQIAPEINWEEQIKNLDSLWINLSVLTHYYEERVLKNTNASLLDTGAFAFLKAYNKIHRFARLPETPEGVVLLFSPLNEEGIPRHLFFPTAK